jgi:hypothetical protein
MRIAERFYETHKNRRGQQKTTIETKGLPCNMLRERPTRMTTSETDTSKDGERQVTHIVIQVLACEVRIRPSQRQDQVDLRVHELCGVQGIL